VTLGLLRSSGLRMRLAARTLCAEGKQAFSPVSRVILRLIAEALHFPSLTESQVSPSFSCHLSPFPSVLRPCRVKQTATSREGDSRRPTTSSRSSSTQPLFSLLFRSRSLFPHYHSLSLIVPHYHSFCHSLSLIITHYHLIITHHHSSSSIPVRIPGIDLTVTAPYNQRLTLCALAPPLCSHPNSRTHRRRPNQDLRSVSNAFLK